MEHDPRADSLIALKIQIDLLGCLDQRDSATGKNALLHRSLGVVERGDLGAIGLHAMDAAGNDVFAGTTRVFVQQALEGGGQATCTMEPDGAHSFFRIGPQGVLDHVNGAATLKYQRFGPGFVLQEELTGSGRMNVHLQGQLQTLIADGENGETWTILTVDPATRSSAESISGAGKVGAAGRDLRCGVRSDAKSGTTRTYVELR